MSRIKSRPKAPDAGGAFWDVISDLAGKSRLTTRQAGAAYRLYMAIHNTGSRSGRSPMWQERVDSTRVATDPNVWILDADIESQKVLDSLSPFERGILQFLILGKSQSRPRLDQLGMAILNYKDANSAQGAAVGIIYCLCESIAHAYDRVDGNAKRRAA